MKKNITIIFLLCCGSIITYGQHATPKKRSTPDYLLKKEVAAVNLFQKVSSSVVTIYTRSEVVSEKGINKNGGLGSGVIISDKSLILTAAHVVAGRTDIQVKTIDGVLRGANLLFSNKSADIALLQLKVPSPSLPYATIGDSDQLAVGQSIFAIGSPYGMENSFSSGIISAFREFNKIQDGTVSVEFIQTDAAINSGNSGGPLFNSKGEVVGIASRILTVSGGFQGIGMAVTINTAKSLLSFEDRPWIGIDGILFPKEELTLLFNINIEHGGILVQSVAKGSPADIAGIRGGSIKTQINGKEVLLGGDIVLSIGKQAACHTGCLEKAQKSLSLEKQLKITYLRAGKINNTTLDVSKTKRNFLASN